MLVSTFCLHRDRYPVDTTYQREEGTWDKRDEQYLIDTILRGYAMPPIFLHEKGDKEFIVDGQQRLNSIWKFKDGKGDRACVSKERKVSGKNRLLPLPPYVIRELLLELIPYYLGSWAGALRA